MSITLGIKDIPTYLKQTPNVMIVNDLACETDVDREYIEHISSTRYDKSERLSTVPSCGCGKEKLGINLGVTCDYCGTEVTMNASNLQSELWLRAPEGTPGLILPKFAIMLIKAFGVSRGYNGFHYLINPRYKSPRGSSANVKRFMRLFGEIPRGIRGFINNIELILDRLESFKGYRGTKLKRYYARYKEQCFPEYLPLPSRLTMIVEDTNVYTYFDKAMDKVLDAIYTMAGISEEIDMKNVESRIGSSLIALAEYHDHILTNIVGGKPGIMRKSLLGSRLSYACRTIVTSESGVHNYMCPKLPKSLATIMFMPAIVGKLSRRGRTLLEAYDYVMANTHKPTDEIVDILYELVEETKPLMKEITGRDDMYGLVTSITRYPGLRLGSSQTFLVREFSDDSIELSVLTLKSSNCDFDGDELSAVWISGVEQIKAYLNLMSHMDIHSSRNPGKFSNATDLPDTTVLNLHIKLESEEFVI